MKSCNGKSNISIVKDYLNGDRPFVTVGYTSDDDKYIIRQVGDKWTDKHGKEWEQKEHGPVRVTKVLDMLNEQEKCSVCGREIRWGDKLDKKMYRKTMKCFDCLVMEETKMRANGTYKTYERVKVARNAVAYYTTLKAKLREGYDYAKKEKEIKFLHSNGREEVWTNESRMELLRSLLRDYKQCCKELLTANSELVLATKEHDAAVKSRNA